MKVDPRPPNATTVKEYWSMPHLDSDLYGFAGSACFSIIDFVSGCWQMPLHPDSYPLCGVITPHGVVASTLFLHGLASATSYFQITVEPLFQSRHTNMKAWLHDSSLYASNEDELLHFIEQFSFAALKAFFSPPPKAHCLQKSSKDVDV